MTASAGFPTVRLSRESIGPFKLKELKAGQVRELSEAEVGVLI